MASLARTKSPEGKAGRKGSQSTVKDAGSDDDRQIRKEGMLTKQPRSRSKSSKMFKGTPQKRLFRLTNSMLTYFEVKPVST